MRHTFATPGPTSLYVEVGSGLVKVHAVDTTEAEILVEGEGAEDVVVEQRGEEIVVKARQRQQGFFDIGGAVHVTASVPVDSALAGKLASADLVATGRFGPVHVKNGSGAVTIDELAGDAVIHSGSGDVRIRRSAGELRVKSGSGSVEIDRSDGSTVIASGSGRIGVDSAHDETVAKTGSGDVRIATATSSVSVTSGSGDLDVGSISRGVVRAKSASGDIRVGVPAGIPVWTDISTVTGDISSDLQGAGPPEEGQDHVEIRASTVSGDINLTQI